MPDGTDNHTRYMQARRLWSELRAQWVKDGRPQRVSTPAVEYSASPERYVQDGQTHEFWRITNNGRHIRDELPRYASKQARETQR